jgi:hypothetical protein
MNGKTRKKLYKLVVKRDGEYCKMCGALPNERQLILEHRDNDDTNNNLENIQIMCRPCNYRKNPRESERPENLCVKSYISTSKITEMQVNKTKEPLFKKYVAQWINEYGYAVEKDLTNAGAEHVGISQVTVKRYLDKMCSLEGIYRRYVKVRTPVITYK